MKFIVLIIFLLSLPLVSAETTFFDQEDAFVMGEEKPTSQEVSGGGGRRLAPEVNLSEEIIPGEEQEEFETVEEEEIVEESKEDVVDERESEAVSEKKRVKLSLNQKTVLVSITILVVLICFFGIRKILSRKKGI